MDCVLYKTEPCMSLICKACSVCLEWLIDLSAGQDGLSHESSRTSKTVMMFCTCFLLVKPTEVILLCD